MQSLGPVLTARGIFGIILVALLLTGQAISAQVPTIGDVAPDFSLEQLEGDPISLSALRGKVVFINFFGFL
jgi:peroxiredoxin